MSQRILLLFRLDAEKMAERAMTTMIKTNNEARKRLKEAGERLKFHQEARTYPGNQGGRSEIPSRNYPGRRSKDAKQVR